jgi:ABC-type polysaccharide/polyol phosphate export permease
MPALGIYGLVHLALRAPIGAGIFMLPLLIAVQTVMNVGLGLLFATLTVLIRDMSNLINYIVRALTFLTPVVYPISALSPTLRQILSLNPLYPLFACYQAIVVGATPSGGMVFASIAWALVFLALGTWMFLRHERSFALHL